MSRHHFRGAPAAYTPGGQSQSARDVGRRGTQARHRAEIRALFEQPDKVAAAFPRITWEEALTSAGENARLVKDPASVGAVTFRYAFPPRAWHQAALALYDMRAPALSVQAAVESAWMQNSTLLAALAGDEMFPILRYCQFRPPHGLPEVVPVWRGTRGVDIDTARAGLSWSLNPQVACAWAIMLGMRAAGPRVEGAPLVLRREIKREQILFYTDEHGMEEVAFDQPPEGEIDGEFEEWMTVARSFAHGGAAREAIARVDGF